MIQKLSACSLVFLAFSFTVFATQSGDAIMYLALARDFVFASEWKFTDPYIYSLTEAPLIWTHEYLSFALFWLAHHLFGVAGLIWLKSLVWTSIFVLTVLHPPRNANRAWLWVGMFLLATVAGSFRFIERSSMFSDFFCVILFAVLLDRDRLTVRFVGVITLLFFLWSQLHPAFVLGLALLGMWTLFHVWRSRTIALRHSLWLLAPTLAVCAHPDAIQALLYPVQFAFNEATTFKKYNFEWMPAYSPLFRFAFETIAFWILAAISLFLLVRERAWFTLRGWFAVFALYLAVTAVRFVPWCSFALVIALKPWAHTRQLQPFFKPWAAIVVCALLLLVGSKNLLYGYTSSSGERLPQLTLDPKFFPVKTVQFLRNNRIAGNLYNTHDFGSYLIWTGVTPVFHHGFMTNTQFYENDVLGVFNGQKRFLQLASKYNWTMLLIEKYGPYAYFYQILASLPRWRIVAEDEASYLIYLLPN